MKEHPEQVPAWAQEIQPWDVVALGRLYHLELADGRSRRRPQARRRRVRPALAIAARTRC